ncbi:MAG: CapA family protein [Treponema sp.]|jgi:poly-gamma-glutamate synthesis protein (capsule biosynthesis protein)|nr:CapA family protein [Treponema sp.]
MRINYSGAALILSIIFSLYSCSVKPDRILTAEPPPQAPLTEAVPELIPEPEPPPDYLSLIAVGDNLYHDVMVRPTRVKTDDGKEDSVYNFSSNYEPVRALVEKADAAFVNQETVFGGRDTGYSGYPLFNTPPEVGEALIGAGFDVVNHATNHIMDKGEKGILFTLDFWDARPEIICLGIHRSQEARDTRRHIVEKNNIKVGFLSYTYGTNGIPIPKDKPYLVSLINTEVMEKEIAAIRPLCDFLVVSMHWGSEYEDEPSREQERTARFLAEKQVDLIIGHHPHVIQKLAVIPRGDGGSSLCVYSLGNFISAQNSFPSRTLLGGMLYLKIKKDKDEIRAEEFGIVPLITHYEKNYTVMRVYPLYDYTEELAERHGIKNKYKDMELNAFKEQAVKALGDKLLDHDPFNAPSPLNASSVMIRKVF